LTNLASYQGAGLSSKFQVRHPYNSFNEQYLTSFK
jgi:hypothetical protein